MKVRLTAYSMPFLLLLATSCEEVTLPEADTGLQVDPVKRAAKAPPVMGGTMLVTSDGAYAVIADPPRDSIHIVDLERFRETETIELEDGALPFRAAEDGDGLVHITLRGTGELVTVDPTAGMVRRTRAVCPNPRGVAFDGGSGDLHVACAGGLLVTLPQSGSATQHYIAPDLRDVFVSNGRTYVSRFKAAELLEVDADGEATLAGAPITLATQGRSHQPSTAWRTLPLPSGGWVMLHQSALTDPVPTFEDPDAFDPNRPAPGPWAAVGGGPFEPCNAVVNPTLSATLSQDVVSSAGLFGPLALAVDVAISPDGQRVAIASPTQGSVDTIRAEISVFEHSLNAMSSDPEQECDVPQPLAIKDDIVAVAYQPDGTLLAQARDEPILYRVRNAEVDQLTLEGADATDTGFELFHNDTGAGLACVSCHPEGSEDGLTWLFQEAGPRRTQALNVGLEGTEPFHWKGDMDSIHMIARQVREGAMGGRVQTEERIEALRDWLFSLQPPNPLRRQSSTRAREGQQLFAELGCGTCHAGPSFTSPASADLGHGPLQTPALRGVALRAPYMHDGRSETLADAVVDMVSTTTEDVELADAEVDALVAYLESL